VTWQDEMSWMIGEWMLTTWARTALVVLGAVIVYATVIALNRLNGLRSFAKMSAFDFAMTVAVGSLMASTLAMNDPPVLQGVVGLATLFGLQYTVARLRISSGWLHSTVDNEPLLLMLGGTMLRANMRQARISEADLWSELRLANVARPEDVFAVVLETTGDVSVLHGGGRSESLDERLLTGVRRE
jgi:uncharacterized membrane protein YcaP (DUF421 family)